MIRNLSQWEVLSREEVFCKYNRGIEKVHFRLPSGGETDFFLSTGHPCIAGLALTKEQQVILVREYRPGPARVLLELPGGVIEPGEALETALARELLEETGYRGTVTLVTSVLPSAYATYIKHAAVITDCEKVAEPKKEDNGEMVETELMSLHEFRRHLRTGQMTDVEIGYLGLDYLGLL